MVPWSTATAVIACRASALRSSWSRSGDGAATGQHITWNDPAGLNPRPRAADCTAGVSTRPSVSAVTRVWASAVRVCSRAALASVYPSATALVMCRSQDQSESTITISSLTRAGSLRITSRRSSRQAR
ncbi:hypothetical protein Ade02nite_30550 [Paractinoplanes deccanensis]|uniref:Secreted protein n=1 Tax=Paractinoplanes deccanensis TaxID=113561 RepID=A0ABQ3Y346_9ACTN|nr:hypothetical protein [Actinoplanes deccanensis]GID74414.1 hypothetical protein Ade02nite_30550 [Actinoplanes deccanensis]